MSDVNDAGSPLQADPGVLEGLARLETAFLNAVLEARTDVLGSGLTPLVPDVRISIQNLAQVLDLTLKAGGEAWGIPARAHLAVLDEDISLEALRELAGDGTGQEPIALPPSVLHRLLALQDLDALLAGETPSTLPAAFSVDVFVNHVRCRKAPGRNDQPGHRWLLAELPNGETVEVLLKARWPEPAA